MLALSDSEEITSLSIAVWPQSTIVTDRRTDVKTAAIPTHWLTAMSRQKRLEDQHPLQQNRSIFSRLNRGSVSKMERRFHAFIKIVQRSPTPLLHQALAAEADKYREEVARELECDYEVRSGTKGTDPAA